MAEKVDADSTPERDQATSWPLLILAVLATLTAVAVAQEFLVPVMLAFLLALVFSPVCRVLARRGIPEPVTAAVIVISLVAAVLTAAMTLAVPASKWIDDAPGIAREVERKLQGLSGAAKAVIEAGEKVEQATSSAADGADEAVEVVVRETGPLASMALSAPLIFAQTAFVMILLYFILASGSLFYERLVSVMPTFADKKRAITISYHVEREVSRYLFSITLINAGLGVVVAIAFVLVGMPNPILFGFLAFTLNYIPFIGALIGTALAFVVALVSMDTATAAILVAGLFWGLTAIEGQFVTPMLVGRQLRLNTVVILISVAFWAWLWSIMGMLMAVPLLVTFRVICSHTPRLTPLAEFLSGRKVQEEDEPASKDAASDASDI